MTEREEERGGKSKEGRREKEERTVNYKICSKLAGKSTKSRIFSVFNVILAL